MASESGGKEHRYGIGAVARLTGLTDHTIRAWERRYATVVARRAANGRRQYSASDVEKLGLLKLLTDQGMAIGQIAGNSIKDLRERAGELGAMAQATATAAVRVVLLGEFLPAQLRAYSGDMRPLEVVLADDSAERFGADLQNHRADVVILESATLDEDTTRRLHAYLKQCRARRGVIVYRFGRARDVERAMDTGTTVLRAPLELEELRAAVIRSHQSTPRTPARRTQTEKSPGEWDFEGPVAPRRFTQQQLAGLASAPGSVECECPRHLAQLVGDLSAFEIYSARCASRSEDDAALHRYLHRTTARARALIEDALAKLARAEGIEY